MATLVFWQVPAAVQVSWVQLLPSPQLWQTPPASPHCSAVGGLTQLEPFLQPVQQLPPAQRPLGHVVPLARLLVEQLPLLQLAALQGSLVEQLEQEPPLSPQALMEVPPWHDDPFQQP